MIIGHPRRPADVVDMAIQRILPRKQQWLAGNSSKQNLHDWLVVLSYPSEKYAKVSWDDELPNRWKVIKNVPNHQPVIINHY